MTKQQTIQTIKNYLLQYPVERVSLFGSFARNEATEDSDIDLLVRFKETIDLFAFVTITQELSELLGRKVDLVTENALHPTFKKYIEKDLEIIATA